MKTWLMSELFYPVETSTGYFMTKIAEKLAENEPDGIHIICGPDKYDSDKLFSKTKLNPQIKIHRIAIPQLNKNNLLQRSLRMFWLAFRMAFKLLTMTSKGDRVFIVTNPAPLLVLVAIVKKIKKFNLVIIVHDVFPENMLAGKMIKSNSLNFKFLKYIFNLSYKQADKIITVGEDMNELILKKTDFQKEQTLVIRNWADCDQIYPLKFTQETMMEYYSLPELKNKLIIQFAGNLGRVQGLTRFLGIFNKINNNDLALIFIGEGAVKQELITRVVNEQIKNVYFFSSKSREEQNVFLNATHMGLVSLNPGMYGLGVPSKTYNIWAAGKPVLFIGDEDSEIARNIVEHNIGWAFNWQEEDKLESFLRTLRFDKMDEVSEKSIRSREAALCNFDREVILQQYEEVWDVKS